MEQTGVPIAFGRQLAALVKARDLSKTRLSKQTNISQELVHALLSDRQILTADLAFLLAPELGLSPIISYHY